MCGESPQSKIAKAVYTLNHLRILEKPQNPAILNHFLSLQSYGDNQSPKPKVMPRDLVTNKWGGPWNVITWGQGYAYVSMDTGTHRVPARYVRPALCPIHNHKQHPPDSLSTDVLEPCVEQ